uniref:Uncharacterized protein n=1 Tax=Anopheles arabiensis TaxID=7173 RepID=A0A182IHA1_ANOAR
FRDVGRVVCLLAVYRTFSFARGFSPHGDTARQHKSDCAIVCRVECSIKKTTTEQTAV